MMALMMQSIRGYIFDLDGTVYEDTGHFDYYSRLLAEALPAGKREAYEQDMRAVNAGDHVLRMGRVYDRARDRVLQTSPGGNVLKAWTWNGSPVRPDDMVRDYAEPVAFDVSSMISMGDGWWIPAAVAYHHGLSSTYEAYVKTKEYMAADQALLTPIPGLASWLGSLRADKRTLVLATNSDLADTERILGRLGLTGMFHSIYTECRKPARTLEVFRRILSDHGLIARECMSIGDNYLNDIYPARQLGMKTCLIDPHRLYGLDAADLVVRSLSHLFGPETHDGVRLP